MEIGILRQPLMPIFGPGVPISHHFSRQSVFLLPAIILRPALRSSRTAEKRKTNCGKTGKLRQIFLY
jgi:hypothetical protein